MKSWLLGAVKPSLAFKGFSALPALWEGVDTSWLTGRSKDGSLGHPSPLALV